MLQFDDMHFTAVFHCFGLFPELLLKCALKMYVYISEI